MACVSKNLTPQYSTEENGSPFVSSDSIAAIFHIYLCLQFGRIFNTKALIMDYRNLIPFHTSWTTRGSAAHEVSGSCEIIGRERAISRKSTIL